MWRASSGFFYCDDVEYTAQTGKATQRLFGSLLLLRPLLPLDNQELEGMASVIQVMCRIAPSNKHSLISDRTCIKKGDRISAEECESLDSLVKTRMLSATHSHRFLPILCPEKVPIAAPVVAQPNELQKLVSPYAFAGFDSLTPGVKHVYTLVPAHVEPRVAFIPTWTYFRITFVARCQLNASGVSLTRPFIICSLSDFLVEMVVAGHIKKTTLERQKRPGETQMEHPLTNLLFNMQVECGWRRHLQQR